MEEDLKSINEISHQGEEQKLEKEDDGIVSLYTKLYNENSSELEELKYKSNVQNIKKIVVVILFIGIIFLMFLLPAVGIPLWAALMIFFLASALKKKTKIGSIRKTNAFNIMKNMENMENIMNTENTGNIKYSKYIKTTGSDGKTTCVEYTKNIGEDGNIQNMQDINNMENLEIMKRIERQMTQNSMFDTSYKDAFKEKIITPVIKHALPDAEYYPDFGINRSEYDIANWEMYDIFDSEDKIVTSVNTSSDKNFQTNLEISEVHTQKECEVSEDTTIPKTVFHGIVAVAKLPKDIGCYLKITGNNTKDLTVKNGNIKMDMSQFEELFDVATDNRLKATQILTSDIMTDLINLQNSNQVKFEIYVSKNTIQIRFHTGPMFEPNMNGRAMQLDKVKKYFNTVLMVKTTVEHMCNIIMQTEL